MARPCKSIEAQARHNTKEEVEARKEQESKLRGSADKVKPPSYLSKTQKKIFKYIVDELETSGIVGNLDVFILSTTAIAIDRLQQIETSINKDMDKLFDKTLMATKEKYTKDLFRCCNELSLSPQSRAKLGNLNIQSKQNNEDELMKILRGDSE